MKEKIVTTLVIVHVHPKVLLGYKKRGFGKGRWNGFGGKVRVGETVEDAARRELREEAGIAVKELRKIGTINFSFEGEQPPIEMYIFRAEKFSGEPSEGEEMRPQWFFIEDIPFREMWPDDRYWFPLFLRGTPFRARFHFAKDQTTILDSHVEPLSQYL